MDISFVKTLAVSAASVILLSMNGFAQERDTARVPITVNVGARVIVTPPDGLPGAAESVVHADANQQTVLYLIKNTGGTSVSQNIPHNFAAAAVRHTRNTVSLTLNPHSFTDAQVSVISINGRRILHGSANAAAAKDKNAFNLTSANIAAGVYLLSVKGADGNAFTSKLAHRGGKLNINVAFSAQEKTGINKRIYANSESELGEWTITVKGIAAAALYTDSVIQITPEIGPNAPLNVTLREHWILGSQFNPEIEYGSYVDVRDNKTYRTVVIGGITVIAENFNYAGESGDIGMCYDNEPDSCAKYGRLYEYSEAKSVCPANWHLITDDEWSFFASNSGGSPWPSFGLKSQAGSWPTGIPLSGLTPVDGNGPDNFGFSAMPGGRGAIHHQNGLVYNLAGIQGHFWLLYDNDEEIPEHNASSNVMFQEMASRQRYQHKTNKLSVRCVMDHNVLDWVAGSQFNPDITYGEITDGRDGKTYRTVVIKGITWMAENLNYAGDKDSLGICARGKSADSCAKYGRLYTWTETMALDSAYNEIWWDGNESDHQGICPAGWRVPDVNVWNTLGNNTIQTSTNIRSQTGWWEGAEEEFRRGTDIYGFSALPTITRGLAEWWTSSQNNKPLSGRNHGTVAQYRAAGFGKLTLFHGMDVLELKTEVRSVRCYRDD